MAERKERGTADSEDRTKSLYFGAASMPADGAWAQKRRLASAMRRIIDRLVMSEAPQDQLSRAADVAERFAESLGEHRQRQRLWGFAEASNAGDVGAFFDQSPMIGLSNPLAPPLRLEVRDGTIHGEVVFGSAYEGPPGHVHGGFVAAAFDEVLGFAQSLSGNPGMTGSLTIRYRRPTPLHRALRFRATVDRIDGRKIYTSGKLLVDEVVTAEAEGLFISVDAAKFQALIEASRKES